ncbi:hypothetical protein Tco_1247855 [Tanacetum coccineum]
MVAYTTTIRPSSSPTPPADPSSTGRHHSSGKLLAQPSLRRKVSAAVAAFLPEAPLAAISPEKLMSPLQARRKPRCRRSLPTSETSLHC